MFAIAVTPGSERRMTTSYSSGFVPTYVPAPTEETQGKKIKRLIVPGYVFVLEKMRGAERVLDAEWKIIEALATPGINTIDQNARVVSGPLVGLDEVVARVEGNRASIHASILGKWRWYEIEVLRTVTEPADTTTEGKIDTRADDSGDASVVESKKMDQEDTKMAEKKTYTEEELNAAIEKAKEVGIHAAAKESGIPWQTIMGAARKAGVEIEPKKTNKKIIN